MQQTKRRSKRGVILLAVVVAMLVMAIVPAVALAATDTAIVNDGQTWAGDTTVKVTYSAASLNANYVAFWVRAKDNASDPTWSAWTLAKVQGASDFGPYAYPVGTTQSKMVVLPNIPGYWFNGNLFQVNVEFYQFASGLGLVASVTSQTVTLDFNGPPISTVSFDPAGHPGRGGRNWTNGSGTLGVLTATFDQQYSAPMGMTYWVLWKNNDAGKGMTPITWSPWGTVNPNVQNTVMLASYPVPGTSRP